MKKPKRKKSDVRSWHWQMQPWAKPIGGFSSTMYFNDLYIVTVSELSVVADRADGVKAFDAPDFLQGWLHLSIRSADNTAIHDWRHLQRIKDELAGEDREAVEIYPARSRVVDEANQFHLWVLPAGCAFPVGFRKGFVLGPEARNRPKASRQRKFSNDDPYAALAQADASAAPAIWEIFEPPAISTNEQEKTDGN